jgi:hypothetical protein
MKISRSTYRREEFSEENSNIQSKKKTEHRMPTIMMEESEYYSRGRNGSRMA